MIAIRRTLRGMGMHFSRSASVILLALTCGACLSVPDRGYYAPDGMPPERSIGAFEGDNPGHHLSVTCQGVYENQVDGETVRTVHMQLLLGALTSSPVVINRRRVLVDLHGPADDPEVPGDLGPVVSLRPSEVWSQRTAIQGDLIVEGYSRRAFDLFFDEVEPFADDLPQTVLLRWQGTAKRRPMAGQCLFERIPLDDPALPSEEPMADAAFGLQDGYYLPGRIRLGTRGLRPTNEERMHYIFHAPRQGWFR